MPTDHHPKAIRLVHQSEKDSLQLPDTEPPVWQIQPSWEEWLKAPFTNQDIIWDLASRVDKPDSSKAPINSVVNLEASSVLDTERKEPNNHQTSNQAALHLSNQAPTNQAPAALINQALAHIKLALINQEPTKDLQQLHTKAHTKVRKQAQEHSSLINHPVICMDPHRPTNLEFLNQNQQTRNDEKGANC